jgi:hypothetical protein
MKAYETDMNVLRQKSDSYKFDLQIEQDEHSRKMLSLIDELNYYKFQAKGEAALIGQQQKYGSDGNLSQKQIGSGVVKVITSGRTTPVKFGAQSQQQPLMGGGARPTRTLPSHDSSDIYAEIENDEQPQVTTIAPISRQIPAAASTLMTTNSASVATTEPVVIKKPVKLEERACQTVELRQFDRGCQYDLRSRVGNKSCQTGNTLEEDRRRLESELLVEKEKLRTEYEHETRLLLKKLNEQLEATKLEKSDIEKQLVAILNELRKYQADNMTLSSKYDHQLSGVNRQLKSIQAENSKTRNENSELRESHNKSSTELTHIVLDSYYLV